MSKFDSIVKTIATKQETNYKAPQTEAPKDIKVSKSLEVLTPEERKIVNQGIIAKSLRQGMGQTLSDADKYGLEALARQKAPTLTTNLVDLVIESDILSPNLAKDMWSATTLGSVIPLETVDDLALAVTIDNDNATMRVIGEGQNNFETTNTFAKMKHFVYDVGGYSSYSYLAESRSIIDLLLVCKTHHPNWSTVDILKVFEKLWNDNKIVGHKCDTINRIVFKIRPVPHWINYIKNTHKLSNGSSITFNDLFKKVEEEKTIPCQASGKTDEGVETKDTTVSL